MAKVRTSQDIQTEFNQKLHTLGSLRWQMEHSFPKQIEQLEKDLFLVEREFVTVTKLEQNKAKEAKKDPQQAPEEPQPEPQA